MSSQGSHADAADPFQRRVAVFMALYTVLIAFNGMLTSQARTQALLKSSEATNQWAYFQAKSTKQVITTATREILARTAPPGAAPLGEVLERLDSDALRYEHEKEEIKKAAEELTENGLHEQHREHFFEYATVLAELAIVLASVALLLHGRPAFLASLVAAVSSVGLTAFTALQH